MLRSIEYETLFFIQKYVSLPLQRLLNFRRIFSAFYRICLKFSDTYGIVLSVYIV